MSRTAWFGIALTAAIMAVAAIRSKKTIALVLLLSVLTLASLYRLVPLVHERVNLIGSDISQYSTDKYAISSIGGRFVIWEAAFLMFKAHPFLGVGTGDFEHTMRVMRKAKQLPRFVMGMNQRHNIHLFPMATNGIVGLIALLLIFYRSLRSAVPIMRADGGESFLRSWRWQPRCIS